MYTEGLYCRSAWLALSCLLPWKAVAYALMRKAVFYGLMRKAVASCSTGQRWPCILIWKAIVSLWLGKLELRAGVVYVCVFWQCRTGKVGALASSLESRSVASTAARQEGVPLCRVTRS